MKRIITLCLLLACTVPLAAWSEDAKPVSGHREAAQELLRLMDAEKNAAAAAQAFLDVIVRQNAQMQDFRDVLVKWANDTLSWDRMEPRMTDLYMRTFTEAEIREIIAFHKTPTGQKMLQQTPMLMQEGMKIGADLARERQGELEKAIKARQKELSEMLEPGVKGEEDDEDEPPVLDF